jgi:plastocyanin
MPNVRWAVIAIATGASILGACGGGGTTTPSKSIAKASPSNDNQTGTVGQQLALPLRVVVTQGGMPLAGETVSWVPVVAGTVTPGGVTDANGIATALWGLGTAAGAQNIRASVTGVSGFVQFAATANPDVAANLAKTAAASGDNQSGFTTSQLNPLRVIATDQYGNPVNGVTVGWQVSVGDATVLPTSEVTGAGGAAALGISHTVVTLGTTAGAITIEATSTPVLTGSPIDFTATLNTPPPAPLAIDVNMGSNFFTSQQNATSNPAVDTLKVTGTATWHAVAAGHGVQSTGSPSFTSESSTLPMGNTYPVQFNAIGTYTYDCIIHGAIMSGRIVVVP